MANLKIEDLEFKIDKTIEPWGVQIEIAMKDGDEYIRKSGSDIVYKQNSNDFKCLTCNSTILAATVIHPVRNGMPPSSGIYTDEVEKIPYCPTCENTPYYFGSPIYIKKDAEKKQD